MDKCFLFKIICAGIATTVLWTLQSPAIAGQEISSAAARFLDQPIPLGRSVAEPDNQEVCRVISFDNTELVGGFVNSTYSLSVAGEKPYVNMKVRLQPVVYVSQPDYWRIEIVGCIGQIGLPALAPYVADLWVTNYMGTKGVEVIGSNQSKKLDK